MASTTTPQEAMHRVEVELRRWEQQRQNQQRMLQLLTAIVETLETTIMGYFSLSPPSLSSIASWDANDAAMTLGPPIQAALGGVLHTLARSQHSVTEACLRFSWRVQAVDEKVQCLRNSVANGALLVRKCMDTQRCERALNALLLAALSIIVRSGCDVTQDMAEGFKTEHSSEQEEQGVPPLLPASGVSSCSNALRKYWQNEEQAFSAAISDVTEVYHSAAYTTCRLLRSSLLETLSAQRWFPSPKASRARHAARCAWYREINEATARRRAAQKTKWERHERAAGALLEREWSMLVAEDTNGKVN
ncbi:hypothetical protein TraAM80_04286 [Trypanosoma rangeli]|uniref:Uncharacterized protein n=1 Tax=Trypanosoma rangeli TaxID=5698 RepID=A0A3R7NQ39_TRYRA|nr:uncharacterized protein TraAM80_04286 [Trypanosoma rangeli]RNF05950.1 hypothetical protein TraAM80_04286 [Trypanosoma rangeli]|eukprot:RNF05950.1 hypothetical protein TraAM80_04286 [Trypanosoma rangeli]